MKHFFIIMILFFMTYIPLYHLSTDQLKKSLGQNFVVCVVLVNLVGVYAPNMPIYFIGIVLVFLATVRGRVESVCRYILLAAIVPQIVWQIGAAGHYLGVIDAAGVLAITAYFIGKSDHRASPGSAGRGWTTEDTLVAVIFLIMAIGTVGFNKFDDALRSWIQQFLLIVTPYILFRSALKTPADYRTVIACFGAASVFLAVFSIFEARLGSDIFDVITKHITGYYVRIIDIRGGLKRASATMAGPLTLACFMTVGVFAVACSRSFFKNAVGYYGSLGVAALGLLATQSRGSLIALFASAVVLALALRRWAVAAAATAAAIAAWPALQALAVVSPAVASFIHGGSAVHQGPYIDYRSLLLDRGLQVAASHLLTGMRLTQVLDSLADIIQGEGIVDLVNVYLEILLISGLVGLVPFLVLTVAAGARGTFGFKRVTDPSLLRMRGFALAAFTVVLFQLGFVSFIDRIPMMLVLALSGIRLLAHERQAIRKPAGQLPEYGVLEAPADPLTQADSAVSLPGHGAAWPRLPVIS